MVNRDNSRQEKREDEKKLDSQPIHVAAIGVCAKHVKP
jgi:hypothetical protein